MSLTYAQVGIGYFPLALEVENVKDLDIPGITRLSCRHLRVSMPIWALLTHKKPLDIMAIAPQVNLNAELLDTLEKASKPAAGGAIYLRRLRVDDGHLSWQDKRSGIAMQVESFQVESITMQEMGALRVTVPHARVVLPISGVAVPIVGQLSLEIKRLPDTLSIRAMEWKGDELYLIGSGRYFLADGSFVLRSSVQVKTKHFLDPIIGTFAPVTSAYGDLLVRKGSDGLVTARASLRSTHFTLSGQDFDHLTASVTWDNQTQEVNALTLFQDAQFRSEVDVVSRPGGTEVFVRNISAAKVAQIIGIQKVAPLRGAIQSAQFLVKGDQVSGSAVLEQIATVSAGFNLAGPVDFLYDTQTEHTRFSCKQGMSELGPFSLDGSMTPDLPMTMEINVAVTLDNLEMADIYSVHFLDLDLARWNLSGGSGRLDVHVQERNGRIDTDSNFILEEFKSSGLPLRNFSGTVKSIGKRADGHMELRDESLNGDVELFNTSDETVIAFKKVTGQLESVLKLLDLDLDLKGQASGEFLYRLKSGNKTLPEISGTFGSALAHLSGFPFGTVSGSLWSDTEKMRLDALAYTFYGGQGKTDLFIDYTAKKYRILGEVKGLDCHTMHPEFSGLGDCRFKGEGAFLTDPIKVQLSSPGIHFYPDRPFSLQADAEVFTDFENYNLIAKGKGERLGSDMPFELKLKSQDDQYSGTFNGQIRDLNLLIPWKDNQGELNLTAGIGTDSQGGMEIKGVANFRGKQLTFPGFAHTVDDFEGYVTFTNARFTLQSFQGTLGGGPIEANGWLLVGGNSLKDVNLKLRGRNMKLYPMDRMRCTLDTDLTLKYLGEKFLLSGQINFLDTLWEREMLETPSFNTEADFSSAETSFLDRLTYDLRMVSKGEVKLRNTLMEGSGTFNLHLGGGFDQPLITGVLDTRRGQIFFGDKKFLVSKAKVLFNNPFVMDPVISLDSETFIQNYRIRFLVSGPLSKLNPVFSSSPPLSQQDILALISQGELFSRPSTTELSSRRGTAGLISGALLEDVQKRAKALFGIDFLRIDPDTEGALKEGGSRVTIGYSVAKNMVAVYSTNMSTSRREVYYVHYQLSPAISLIGMRNEEGYFSIDIRFRKRY